MKKINKLLYIITFALLYIGVALVSTLHSFQFFQLSNVTWIAGLLATCFELGQAAVLFSILTNPKERKKFLPWALMSILTLVQIIGNVYACYKYILMNSIDSLKYFKEPIFVWTKNFPDEQSTVILTYIASSILPIVALAMTAMLTSFLSNEEEVSEIHEEIPNKEELITDVVSQPVLKQVVEEPVKNVEETPEDKEVSIEEEMINEDKNLDDSKKKQTHLVG